MARQVAKLYLEPCVKGIPRVYTIHIHWLDPSMCVFQEERFLVQTALCMASKASSDIKNYSVGCKGCHKNAIQRFPEI